MRLPVKDHLMTPERTKEKATCGALILGHDTLRRLLLAFILREQKTANKKGLIQNDQALAGLIAGKSNAEIDAIDINEDVLGFDSLGTLELITALNQFFGLSTSGIEDYFLLDRQIGAWVDLLAQHQGLVADQATYGFQTSGSTGASKLIHHPGCVLLSEMRAQSAGPFESMTASGRIITLVPPYHIYGFLFGCVFPELVSCQVIDLHNSAPGAAFRHARGGDLIVGTPFHWALLGKIGLPFRENVRGVTSAGPSNAQTWDVVASNGLAQMTEVYGATETAGIGFRTSQETPFQLLSHLNATNGQITRKDTDALLELQDSVAFIAPKKFHVGERLDDVVQVAGNNVSPRHVRKKILLLDGVADAAVRPGADRLRAFIVPKPEADPAQLDAQLRAHIADTLPAPARPTCLTFGPEIPRSELGKPTDWA